MRTAAEVAALVDEHLATAKSFAAAFYWRGVPRQDLRQAAFLGLCEAAATWRPDGAPFHLFCRPHLRKRVLECVNQHRQHTGLVFDPVDESCDRDECGELWAALDSLSPLDRSLLVRRWGLECVEESPEAIARASGLSVRRVREQLATARDRLRLAMSARGYAPRRTGLQLYSASA